LVERFKRAEPPEGVARWAWWSFIQVIRKEVEMLEDEWLLSTTAFDEGTKWCHDRLVVENSPMTLRPPFPCPPHLAETYGEHRSAHTPRRTSPMMTKMSCRQRMRLEA
jgi:hypothetical protein